MLEDIISLFHGCTCTCAAGTNTESKLNDNFSLVSNDWERIKALSLGIIRREGGGGGGGGGAP